MFEKVGRNIQKRGEKCLKSDEKFLKSGGKFLKSGEKWAIPFFIHTGGGQTSPGGHKKK